MATRIPSRRHYLIFDSMPFRSAVDPNEPPGSPKLFDPLHWESFLERLTNAFDGSRITDGREAWAGGTLVYHVAQTRRLFVGLDQNGPEFAFVTPKGYESRAGYVLRPYRIDNEARKGFNKLIRSCPELCFTRLDRSGSAHVVRRYRADATSRLLEVP